MKETQTIVAKKQSSKTSERISGSEAVIKCLLAEDVDVIYGYPGGAIMPVYDELYKYQDKIISDISFQDIEFGSFNLYNAFF